MQYTLYVHIFPNQKLYFGITKGNVLSRWCKDGNGYHTQLVWRAIQKYGWDNIQHIVLLEGLSKEVACECEKYLIAKYQTTNSRYGYNVSSGGECSTLGLHWNLSEETKLKISNSIKGHQVSEETRRKIGKANSVALKGKISPMKGRHVSEITKKKQSESAKRRFEREHSPMYGRHHTEETKQKISLKNTGKIHVCSDDTKQKIGKANLGKIRTLEQRENISKAHIGIKKSKETCRKMSESHLKYYANPEIRVKCKERTLKGWETRRRNNANK